MLWFTLNIMSLTNDIMGSKISKTIFIFFLNFLNFDRISFFSTTPDIKIDKELFPSAVGSTSFLLRYTFEREKWTDWNCFDNTNFTSRSYIYGDAKQQYCWDSKLSKWLNKSKTVVECCGSQYYQYLLFSMIL